MTAPVDAVRHDDPPLRSTHLPAGKRQHQDFQDLGIVRMGTAMRCRFPNPVKS